VNCTDDPLQVPQNDKGMFDWDGQKKSFGLVIRYSCDKPGWGFPSIGQSESFNECQADKSWTLTEIEECICKLSKHIMLRDELTQMTSQKK
jgi:hypothetical protein